MTHIYCDGSFRVGDSYGRIGVPHVNLAAKVKARNGVATELIAILRACKYARDRDYVVNDNKGLITRLKSKRHIKRHKELSSHILKLVEAKNLGLRWVNRKRNKKADRLSRKVILD